MSKSIFSKSVKKFIYQRLSCGVVNELLRRLIVKAQLLLFVAFSHCLMLENQLIILA